MTSKEAQIIADIVADKIRGKENSNCIAHELKIAELVSEVKHISSTIREVRADMKTLIASDTVLDKRVAKLETEKNTALALVTGFCAIIWQAWTHFNK